VPVTKPSEVSWDNIYRVFPFNDCMISVDSLTPFLVANCAHKNQVRQNAAYSFRFKRFIFAHFLHGAGCYSRTYFSMYNATFLTKNMQ